MIILILFYLLFPALVVWLCRRVAILGKIGPILLLYLVGIVVGNIGVLPDGVYSLQDALTSATIPIAIPLMLFSTTIKRSVIRSTIFATLSGVLAVMIVVVGGSFLLKEQIATNSLVGDGIAKLAGLLCGVYTGGTPNLAALKMLLGVPEELYIVVHTYDMLICLSYFVFLLLIGIRIFRWLLPSSKAQSSENLDIASEDNYHEILTREGWLPTLKAVALSIAIVAVSVGLAFLLTGGLSMAVVILSLTTFGLLFSLKRNVREIKTSFSAGMYLILIFSLVVASMANLSELNLSEGLYILAYLGAVVFGSLVIQTILARIFRLDADTMIISSVSLINSPPFVPMICSAMRNRDVLVVGLSVGIVGYAVGNYLGYMVFQILNAIL